MNILNPCELFTASEHWFTLFAMSSFWLFCSRDHITSFLWLPLERYVQWTIVAVQGTFPTSKLLSKQAIKISSQLPRVQRDHHNKYLLGVVLLCANISVSGFWNFWFLNIDNNFSPKKREWQKSVKGIVSCWEILFSSLQNSVVSRMKWIFLAPTEFSSVCVRPYPCASLPYMKLGPNETGTRKKLVRNNVPKFDICSFVRIFARDDNNVGD